MGIKDMTLSENIHTITAAIENKKENFDTENRCGACSDAGHVPPSKRPLRENRECSVFRRGPLFMLRLSA